VGVRIAVTALHFSALATAPSASEKYNKIGFSFAQSTLAHVDRIALTVALLLSGSSLEFARRLHSPTYD